jgi:hypothetical protein
MYRLEFFFKLPEYVRVYRFRAEQSLRRWSWIPLFVRQRLGLILVFLPVAIMLGIIDIRLIPTLPASSPIVAFLEEFKKLTEVIQTLTESLATILGLLVTIFIFVFQLASDRYGFTYKTMRFFAEDKAGNLILDFLTLSFLVSLWSLFLFSYESITPYASSLASILLGFVSILCLVVYFKQALYLNQPETIYQRLAYDISDKLTTLRKGQGKLGRSVENYLRRTVVDRLDLFKAFVELFAEDRRTDIAAAEGVANLLQTLKTYASIKRHLDPEAEWFPQVEVPMEPTGYTTLRLISWAKLSGLGTPPTTRRERDWFEKRVISFVHEMFSTAIESEQRYLVTVIPATCDELLTTAFAEQEFDIFESVAREILFPYVEQVSEATFPIAVRELYRAIWQSCRAIIRGFDYRKYIDTIAAADWRDARAVKNLELPKLFLEDALALQERIEYEILIAGQQITPREHVVTYVQQSAVAKTEAKRTELFRFFVTSLSRIVEKGIEGQTPTQVRNGTVTQLTLLRQALVEGETELCIANMVEAVGVLTKAIRLLTTGEDTVGLGPDLLEETFHFLVNLIHAHRTEHFEQLLGFHLALYGIAANAQAPEKQVEQTERLIILGGLALLGSEFYEDSSYMDAILELYSMTLQVQAILVIIEAYLTDRFMTIPWITKYDHIFAPITHRIYDLPREYIGPFYSIEQPKHNSEVIQRLGRRPLGIVSETACVKEFYIRLCEHNGVEANEKIVEQYF